MDSIDDSPLAPALLRACDEAAVADTALEGWVKRLDDPYKTYLVKKRSGRGVRRLDVPAENLRRLQSWLLHEQLEKSQPHPAAYAYRPDYGTLECAGNHTGSQWLLRLDIRDFFTSIDERMVFRSMRRVTSNSLEAFQLARIFTRTPATLDLSLPRKYWEPPRRVYRRSAYSPARIGFLPQGAPSSGYVSNLVMFNADQRLARLAAENGLRYSRYADDMFFSRGDRWTREGSVRFLGEAVGLIRRRGFEVNRAKTRISGPGSRRVMLGLRVDGDKPTLTPEFRKRIDWHIRGIALHGLAAHSQHAGFDHPRRCSAHVRGLLDYAMSVDREWCERPMTIWLDLSTEWLNELEADDVVR